MTFQSISDFSLLATKQYLQSAVFIDDEIYNENPTTPDSEEIVVRRPKVVMQIAGGSADLLSERKTKEEPTPVADDMPKQNFRKKDLVGSFAEHGIVCALYEPEENFETGEDSTVFKLCQTADLVILDWDFHEDGVKGEKPKALIENLIKNGNSVAPYHVRLIAIYTNTPSLQSIANSLFQHLNKAQLEPEPIECQFRLQAGSSRVIILGKTGGVPRRDEEESFTISEKELADRLLSEFSYMNFGILPSCALLGMATVRHNSARILDKFRANLDGQFLLHRALIRGSEEAFDQLPELLGDEFRAVIEDSYYSPEDVTKFVADTSAVIEVSPPSPPWKIKGRSCDVVLKEFWVKDNDLLKPLMKREKADPDDGDQPKNPIEKIAVMCSVNDGDAHSRFAALLTIRTQYKTKYRNLGFGTILLDRSNGKYSVCIVPPCDSLRLNCETNFPFWYLTQSKSGHPIIFQCPDGKWRNLTFKVGKPSQYMWFGKFLPDAEKKIVRVTKDDDEKYIFKSGVKEFEWVAQLKPSHAQRIANTIGQQLSRVGLAEAEWARMAFSKD
ncbi:MAG: response regulator receiver domain [Nitrospirales bacterium]|nr:response regulator receiver domain [Nitrospirales bacterium]